MKCRILFVDDEPHVLSGLKRMLRIMRREWEMAFVESGPKALEVLAAASFDVIIADMRMPGMDGAQLLEEVARRHPEMVRIILSGHSDEAAVLRTVKHAHQYLAKVCSPEEIKSTITRAIDLRKLLTAPHLQKLVSRIDGLPSLPSLYAEIMAELRAPNSSLQRIGRIIGKDAAMSAKILQLVNSAFFGLSRQVSAVTEAVNYLGIDTIKALALSVEIFSAFDARSTGASLASRLWEHSLAVGLCAKTICRMENRSRAELDDAFTAGLLHDVGKLIFIQNFPDRYIPLLREARKKPDPLLVEMEQEAFKATHAEVGAFLLGLWRLPDTIVEAIAFHHMPENSAVREVGALAAVHVGNGVVNSLGADSNAAFSEQVSERFIRESALIEKLPSWRTTCINTLSQEENDA